MKRSFTVMVAAAITAAFSASLSAQWDLRPLPGVPKGPDGKVITLFHEDPTNPLNN